MYTGNNPTALRSQKMFIEALSQLMRKKAFADISVKEICQEADLSRQTFYLLFSTKESILNLRFERVFAQYAAILSREPHLTTQKVANWFVQFLQSESDFIKQLVQNRLTPIMIQHFRRYLCKVDEMILSGERPMREYAMAFLAGALVETAAAYVQDNAPPAGEELSQTICKILTGGYFAMGERAFAQSGG